MRILRSEPCSLWHAPTREQKCSGFAGALGYLTSKLDEYPHFAFADMKSKRSHPLQASLQEAQGMA